MRLDSRNQAEEVIASKRLIDSTCTLVNPKERMNLHVERLMRGIDKNFQRGKRTPEIDLGNPLNGPERGNLH